MHLFFFVRGIYQEVEKFKAQMQSQSFKWRRTDVTEKEEKPSNIIIQGAFRPSVLGAYEYVFPKEALPEVVKMLHFSGNESYGFSKLNLKLRHAVLRKIFGVKKIPQKVFKEAEKIPESIMLGEYERCLSPVWNMQGVAIHIIGIRDDPMGFMDYPDGKRMFQELL